MLITLDSIGMRLTYDREGRYPIDISEPIDLPSYQKEFDCYMSLKQPKQLEDGSWEWYYNDTMFQNNVDTNWGYNFNRITTCGGPFGVKVGHKLVKNKRNISINNITIEEMVWAEKAIDVSIFKNWFKDKAPLISSSDGVMNYDEAKSHQIFSYFKPDGNTALRYEDYFGEEFFFLEKPYYISGINYESVALKNNELFFKKTLNNKEFSFGARLMIPSSVWDSENTVDIYEDNYIKIYVDLANKNIVFVTKGLLNTSAEKYIYLPNTSNEFFNVWLTYNNGVVKAGVNDNIETYFSKAILKPKYILNREELSNIRVEVVESVGRVGRSKYSLKIINDEDDKFLKYLYYNDYDELSYKYDLCQGYRSTSRCGHKYHYSNEYEVHKYGLSNMVYRSYGCCSGGNAIETLRSPIIGKGSKIKISNIDGPFYLWPWLNVGVKQRIYKNIQRIHPISGKLETVSSELIIV